MISRQNLDIIERMMKDLARTFALLMGKSVEEKLEFVETAYREWLGLSVEEIEKMDADQILEVLVEEQDLDIHQLELLAMVIGKEGECYFEKQDFSKSEDRIRKALIIFEHIEKSSEVYSMERKDQIKQLGSLLEKARQLNHRIFKKHNNDLR